jgi:hypothetical protein
MEESNNLDYLGFKNDPSLPSIIGEEELLFSDKLIKVNRYGLSQERNIIVTNKAIYNLKKKSKYIFILFFYSLQKTYSFKYYTGNHS